MVHLVGLSKEDLSSLIASKLTIKTYQVDQIWSWIYNKGVPDFDLMTNLSIANRATLKESFTLQRLKISNLQKSSDGTIKWLLKLDDGNEVETVYIPEEDRGTLCISSQVGCTLTCKFCHTGTQRLVRNLTSREIIEQVLAARDYLKEWPSTQKNRQISNVVLMGMGEPLYNYDNVSAAIKIIMDDDGIAISRRKITLSTSGVVPEIERCGSELRVNLAISLHAPNNEIRTQIMPINKKYPIEQLIDVCRKYQDLSNSRRITFEYVMLKGVNDSISNAKELGKLITGIQSIVNLIPFNPWPGSNFECSDRDTIRAFSDYLTRAGHYAPIRKTRGQDILAACGQLKSESLRLSKAHSASSF